MQLAAGEVERRLRMLAPDISEDVIRDVMTARRSRSADILAHGTRAGPVGCPWCRRPMRQVTMGGVHVARCDGDNQIWFEASELERVVAMAGARHQTSRSWIARLFSHLFAT
jgi:hypothetical protein